MYGKGQLKMSEKAKSIIWGLVLGLGIVGLSGILVYKLTTSNMFDSRGEYIADMESDSLVSFIARSNNIDYLDLVNNPKENTGEAIKFWANVISVDKTALGINKYTVTVANANEEVDRQIVIIRIDSDEEIYKGERVQIFGTFEKLVRYGTDGDKVPYIKVLKVKYPDK